MVKKVFSIIGSLGITVVLFLRVVNAKSLDEVVVIGALALFTGAIALYLLFTSSSKGEELFYKKKYRKDNVAVYYKTILALLVLMEIFLYFTPLDKHLFEIPKTVLMLFFFVGITILCILLYRKKRGQPRIK